MFFEIRNTVYNNLLQVITERLYIRLYIHDTGDERTCGNVL